MALKNIQRVDNYEKANDFLRIARYIVNVVDCVKSPLSMPHIECGYSMYNKARNVKTKHKHINKCRYRNTGYPARSGILVN